MSWMNLIPYQTTKITVELNEAFPTVEDLFDFTYPIFTPEHKTSLENKIYEHYYFRQIGQETPARFKHYLKARMREIMPYYIQLLESETIKDNVDIFDNYLLVEEYTRTLENTTTQEGSSQVTTTSTDSETSNNSGTNTGTEVSTSTGKTTVDGANDQTNTNVKTSDVDTKLTQTTDKTSKFSDTPQGDLANLDNYLTNATVETGSGSDHTQTVVADTETQGIEATHNETTDVTGNTDATKTENYNNETSTESTSGGTAEESNTMEAKNTQTETYTINRHGNIGVQTFGDELQKYRDILLNIDVMIIENLADLFLGVY